MNQAIKINPKAIKTTDIYTQHEVQRGKQIVYAKVFYQNALQKYDLMQAIDYNAQVLLDSYQTLTFTNRILPILETIAHKTGIIFLTPKYQYRLDEYLIRKGGRSQQQIMEIANNIIQAMYGILISGYFHRNIRLEHFVYHQKTWKLQSMILNQATSSLGLKSEYLWSNEHRTPEQYNKSSYQEQQLDQKIVWDFGNIVISLILGHHHLKNKNTLDYFKNQGFSFKKVRAPIGQKYSEPLKQILAKMCHYNPQKRMKLKELLLSGFFSKKVAELYKDKGCNIQPKIFIGGSSSASKQISLRKYTQEDKLPNTKEIQKDYEKKLHISSEIMDQQQNEEINSPNKFKGKLSQIKQIYNQKQQVSQVFKKRNKVMEIEEIDKSAIELGRQNNLAIIDQFKNYFDKGRLLTISDSKLQQAVALAGDQQKAQGLLNLSKYALHFVKCMDLCILASTMNNNSSFQFMGINYGTQWQCFQGSQDYYALQKLANHRKMEALKKFEDIRMKIIAQPKKNFKNFTQFVYNFVNETNPQKVNFTDIKRPYREILKKSYDMVVSHYTKNKTQQWATVGMYITFCLAIDKIYIPQDFEHNFRFYLKWSCKQKLTNKYVALDDFKKYIQTADKQILVENSIDIISRYYKI